MAHFLGITGALTAVASPENAEAISIRSTATRLGDPNRVPHPSHRHASPSAPWPWVDLEDEVDEEQLNNPAPPIPPLCLHGASCGDCWIGYPQSRFPNWTKRQVFKSKIYHAIRYYNTDKPCVCHLVDVDSNGLFNNAAPIVAEHNKAGEVWKTLIADARPPNLRVRAIFLENLSGPVLQMLGTKYNIEPFFWSSSLNWIPSRFQEEVEPNTGDHITITLTFLKSMSDHDAMQLSAHKSTDSVNKPSTLLGSQNIDTQAPLILHSNNRLLLLDLLAVHLIRNVKGSTIISYHPTMNLPTTTAQYFHTRILFAGQSVYWQNIFQKSPDPTFVLLTFIWHAMYAWDEALENLYQHICHLEARVIGTNDMKLTQELHVIRAHHLHYSSLLDDYSKHVDFIRNTKSPLLDTFSNTEREYIDKIMKRECDNLLTEVNRLKVELNIQEKRLKNVMGLVFSRVNIEDSGYMRKMTAAAVRDSNGTWFLIMKQIAYLTMAFLPASFVAAVFGMNVREINPGTFGTLSKYFSTALPLTIVTAWVVTAFQYEGIFPNGASIFKRLAWPFFLIIKMFKERRANAKKEEIELDYYSITAITDKEEATNIQ